MATDSIGQAPSASPCPPASASAAKNNRNNRWRWPPLTGLKGGGWDRRTAAHTHNNRPHSRSPHAARLALLTTAAQTITRRPRIGATARLGACSSSSPVGEGKGAVSARQGNEHAHATGRKGSRARHAGQDTRPGDGASRWKRAGGPQRAAPAPLASQPPQTPAHHPSPVYSASCPSMPHLHARGSAAGRGPAAEGEGHLAADLGGGEGSGEGVGVWSVRRKCS